MAKITKTLAESVSLQMTVGLEEKREAIRKEIAEFLREKHLQTIPAEVIAFYHKFPSYVSTTNNSVVQCGKLRSYERISYDAVPSLANCSSVIELESAEYEMYVQLLAKREEFEMQRYKLRSQIEATLQALSTPKRIAEHFPQALPFLPADFLDNKSTVPAVQMGDLLAQLEQIKTL